MRIRQLFLVALLTLGFGMHSSIAVEVTIQANDDIVIGKITRGPFTISNLCENDTISAGPIFLYGVSRPLYGYAEIRSGNVVIYTPKPSFKGEDSFQYAISTAPNGVGATSVATVTVRNPYFLNRGTYTSAIDGIHQVHEESGYFVMTTDMQGQFTATLRFAGQAYPFKGVFDSEGHYSANIARKPPLSNLTLDVQFPLEGPSALQCQLTNGGTVTSFTADLNMWSLANRPAVEGRYSITLPAPDNKALTPQGSGYATFAIGKTGTVSIVGRTGDNRSFTMASKLLADNTIPFYIGLYHGGGSLFGPVTLTVVDPGNVTAAGSLIWTKPKNLKDKLYPKGFILTLAPHGTNYIEPKPSNNVLSVGTTTTYNSHFTIAAGVPRLGKTERALLGNRPDNGRYALAFDNSKRLRAEFSISPLTGIFTGSFHNGTTHTISRMSGIFVQGENAAYGLWGSAAKTGSVLLQPDAIAVP